MILSQVSLFGVIAAQSLFDLKHWITISNWQKIGFYMEAFLKGEEFLRTGNYEDEQQC